MGKLNGLLSTWHQNGKKMSETPYIDGKKMVLLLLGIYLEKKDRI